MFVKIYGFANATKTTITKALASFVTLIAWKQLNQFSMTSSPNFTIVAYLCFFLPVNLCSVFLYHLRIASSAYLRLLEAKCQTQACEIAN